MQGKMWLFLGLVAFLAAIGNGVQSVDRAKYTVFFPRSIYPGMNFSYTITLGNINHPVKLVSIFHSQDGAFELKKNITIAANSTALVVLGKIPFDYMVSRNVTLDITAIDVTSGLIFFRNVTSSFEFLRKDVIAKIQTDKYLYRPGDKVKFRAILLQHDLFPIVGNITYRVMDPMKNAIIRKEDVFLSHGVAADELMIGEQAAIGEYNITVEYKGFIANKSFWVNNHDAPKFKVILKNPEYITPALEGFTVSLKASYPSGEGVKGKATLLVALKSPGEKRINYGRISKRFPIFSSSLEYFFTKSELMRSLNWDGFSKQYLVVVGIVEEELSSIKYNDSNYIKVSQSHIKIEPLRLPGIIKPGLPYHAYLKVSEQDDKRLMESVRTSNDLIAVITYKYTSERPINLLNRISGFENTEVYSFGITPSGIVLMNFTARKDNFLSASVKVYIYTNDTAHLETDVEWFLQPSLSPSSSYLKITTNQTQIYPGLSAIVNISTTEIVENITILVLSRGQILHVGTSDRNQENNFIHTYKFMATREMTPSVEVMAYYMKEDGEIVADKTSRIDIFLDFLHNVSLDLSPEDNLKPKSKVAFKVKASPNSFIALQTLPLFENKTEFQRINEESLFEKELMDLKSEIEVDSYRLIKKLDMMSFSDGMLYEASEQEIIPLPKYEMKKEISLKKFYNHDPVSWIWHNEVTGINGTLSLTTSIPDKLMNWSATGFAISRRFGLGIIEPLKLAVSQKLFMTLDLPHKLTRGEIAIAKVLVFNNFDRPLPVAVSLEIDEKLGLKLIKPRNSSNSGKLRHITVPANGIISIQYPIRFGKMGDKPIRVKAWASLASMGMLRDSVERRVFVKPQGIKKCYAKSLLLDQKFSSNKLGMDLLEVMLPSNLLMGTSLVNLTIYGDLLGSLMNHIRLFWGIPHATSEQNMVTYAPIVFLTSYLKEIQKLNPILKKKAESMIRKSYMEELRFKRKNGAFSMFGNKDKLPSVWQTAFVTKCFALAKELDPQSVEDVVLDGSVTYLLGQQMDNGTYHCGRVSREGPLLAQTAYVLIALQESKVFRENAEVRNSSIRAMKYLESMLKELKFAKDSYTLSLVSYALHLTYSSKAQMAFEMLESLAIEKDGFKFWEEKNKVNHQCKVDMFPEMKITPSREIETASYSLLTHILRNEFASALPILKYLVSKQDIFGKYSSAQDTVIGIQALMTSARLLAKRPQKLNLTIFHHDDKMNSTVAMMNESTKLSSIPITVAQTNGSLWLTSNGVGSAVAQLSVCYNTPISAEWSRPYNCSINTSTLNNNNNNDVILKMCCLPKKEEKTGNILYQIRYLNGFALNKSMLLEDNPDAKNVEITDDYVVFYYDGLMSRKNVCATIYQTKVYDIAALQPANITVLEYLHPEKKMILTYNATNLNESSVCDVCGSHCSGCKVPELRIIEKWTSCVELCQNEVSTRIHTCIDTNRNVSVDPTLCGITELTTRTCRKENFPCPSYYDGLWYDLPPSYGVFNSSKCQIRGELISSPISVIPGSFLDGRSSYIDCGRDHLVASSGWTYSFLLKFREHPLGRDPIQFLYVGSDVDKPSISFQMTRRHYLQLSVIFGKMKRTVIIPQAKNMLPEDEWKLITLSWNLEEDPKIYINGEEIQAQSSSLQDLDQSISNKDLDFFLGYEPGRTELENGNGFINGVLSGLTYWHRALSPAEIQQFYRFFEPLLASDEESTLTPRQLQFFSPREVKSCFDSPSVLSSFYIEDEPMCKFDQEENMFGFFPTV